MRMQGQAVKREGLALHVPACDSFLFLFFSVTVSQKHFCSQFSSRSRDTFFTCDLFVCSRMGQSQQVFITLFPTNDGCSSPAHVRHFLLTWLMEIRCCFLLSWARIAPSEAVVQRSLVVVMVLAVGILRLGCVFACFVVS